VRVLLLTHRLPYAPNRGDRIRAYYLLEELRKHFDVELVSLVHDEEEASHANEVETRGIRLAVAPVPKLWTWARAAAALPGSTPLTHCFLTSPRLRSLLPDIVATRQPDVVLAYCSGMARYALERPLNQIPLVLDMVDLDSAKWHALAASSDMARRWIYTREHRTLQAFECRAVAAATATLVVNDRERQVLAALMPGARVHVVQNGVDVERFRRADVATAAPVAVFCGVMNYGPNEEGARWIAQAVWPLVQRARPDARLLLVGANPTPAVKSLASSSIVVTGTVPDIRPYLWEAAAGVAPLFTARGVQNKVLEAIAARLPTVVTPAVKAGLPPEVLGACRVAESPETFSRAILELFDLSPDCRDAVAAEANLTDLTWSARLADVPGICRAAASMPPPAAISAEDADTTIRR
jgi:sugar transferase (PEP-CTERM/EpsH1 system associated)